MVLNWYNTVNYTEQQLKIVNDNNHNDDHGVPARGQARHDLWLGGSMHTAKSIVVKDGQLKKDVAEMWDEDWSLRVKTALGETKIPVDSNKDFSVEIHDDNMVLVCYNGVFKFGVDDGRVSIPHGPME